MHFIVANIVMPLTRKKEVSFVALWGGRPVDYFVLLASTIRLHKNWFGVFGIGGMQLEAKALVFFSIYPP